MNYLYHNGAERYQFYRIPKALFTDSRFACLSGDAKILYGLMLDRASLSTQNGWLDEQSRVYIYFSTDEICDCLGCARKKALKLLADLDAVGLTRRKIRGQGKPTLIYVREFTPEDFQDTSSQTCENHTPRSVKITPPEVPFSPSLVCEKGTQNHTDSNQTDLSKTHSNHSPTPEHQSQTGTETKGSEATEQKEMDCVRAEIQENIRYDDLIADNPSDADLIDEMVELMTETVCTRRKSLRVGGEHLSSAVVTHRLMKLRQEHILTALNGLKANTTKVRNIRQYLLTVLYNAPNTISSYYMAKVNHDLYGNTPY